MKSLAASLGIMLLAAFHLRADTITLEQARNLALANSRTLASMALTVQGSELAAKTQFFSLLPKIDLGASAGAALWNSGGSSAGLVNDSLTAGANLSVSESIPVWDGRVYSIQKMLNGLNTESARQDALAAYFSVLGQADAAYYAVLEARAGLEVAEASLKTASLSLSIAEIRRLNSIISEANYLQALAEKESREASHSQNRRELSLAELKLKNMLGIAALPELEPVDFSSFDSLIQRLANLDDEGFSEICALLWKDIERRNPALIKEGISSSRAGHNLNLANWAYSPTLSASFSTGLVYDIKGDSLNVGDGKVSVNLSIPLDFWVKAANVEKQKIALNQSNLQYYDARENLNIQLQTVLLNIISQSGQVLSSQRAMAYAELNLERVMELYRLNQNSQSNLSEAESTWRNNSNQLIRARFALLSALSTLRGLGVFESGEELAALLMREGALK